ncbi:MAG TPA: biotin carboxylase N-terminal domain-containing protein [Polyangiaceae bacterium]|nr:biotin carboxylase N-terminal domain-containing protein [Polyangiaceae bacterium]
MQSSPETRQAQTTDITRAMSALITPGGRYVGSKDALATLAGVPDATLAELTSLPLGAHGQRLVALRYFIVNGATWLRYFSWEGPLAKQSATGPSRIKALAEHVDALRADVGPQATLASELDARSLESIAGDLEHLALDDDAGLRLLVALAQYEALGQRLIERMCSESVSLVAHAHRAADLLYLATFDLRRFPATTVGEGSLRNVIVADKGEMGVRAVREAIQLGLRPVVLYNQTDDADSLQVREAEAARGFGIALTGTFRESYASYEQIARRVLEDFATRFGEGASAELACSALYPGYGPLAENTAAIEHFRKAGIVFVGPMQDVVERAGDKRKFRLLAQSIDPQAVVPGIVMDEKEPEAIIAAIEQGYAEKRFSFPGRLKAANGGGGRGQMVIATPDLIPTAVQKVLGEIQANGWDHGVMFEQNIPETIHLEVQVVRDRYGNTRHFGMRDCSEQRASQKIQEEAPPALLRFFPGLSERICAVAVSIADAVGYVGACTVELMFKDGHFYLLEMNTRIQVEHPVTEAAHRVRRGDTLTPLNLVQLQLGVARGQAIDFAQADVVQTHVAREFRINAESWRADVKDSRDGKKGLFLPNGGTFDVIELPDAARVREALVKAGVAGIADLQVRLDSGFEVGDKLVNKDPTFAKLIVSLQADEAHRADEYELLRLASIEVLRELRIEGRQALPTGAILEDSPFQTNIADHVRVLDAELLRAHSKAAVPGRHVNWVVGMLRAES